MLYNLYSSFQKITRLEIWIISRKEIIFVNERKVYFPISWDGKVTFYRNQKKKIGNLIGWQYFSKGG